MTYPLFLSDLNENSFSRQIFEKYPKTKFHENASSGSRVVACGQTDRQTDIANWRFRNFANAPNNQSLNPHLFQIVILAPVYIPFAV